MIRIGVVQRRWWEFLVTMIERELKIRYKLSRLGWVWVLLNPIIQMLIIGIVFRYFSTLKQEDYFVYLFSGLIMWNFFSVSIIKSTASMVTERYLLKKSVFPRETIVIAIILVNLFQLLVSYGLLMVIAFLLGVQISWSTIWCLPIILILMTGFLVGCCLLLAAINVKYRDTNFVVNFIVSLWFYATPIIYSIKVLPEEISKLLYINPLTGLLELFRWSIFNWQILNIWLVLGDVLLTGIIFGVGLFVFKKLSPNFDDWI